MGRASRRSDQQSALRRRAESRVRQRQVPARAPDQVNLQRAVHELEVHQVELEIQNEQMRITQAELAATRDRYASLFSLAPTAYLVLDPLGNILDANQVASLLLRRPLHLLRKRTLASFLRPDDRPAFVRHLVQAAASGHRTHPLQATLEGPPVRIVRLETFSEPGPDSGGQQYRTAMIDLTDQVLGERQLRAERHALQRSQTALRELTHRLMVVEEDQRRRIAADLHDDIGQRLHAVQMELALLRRNVSGEAQLSARLRTARRHLEEVIGDLAGLARTLHPKIVDDLGLRVGLQAHTADVGRQTGMEVRFRERAVPDAIPAAVATCLYRVAQEALRNVRRHAGAKAATVTLARVRHGLGLCVADGGRGFDPERAPLSGHGLGLVTMNERVGAFDGHFRIRTNPGAGTHVHAWVPLP
jgi:signal transduction histidine kinase